MTTTERVPSVGFISPPRWHDPAPHEFEGVCGSKVRTQQTILPFPDFEYRLENVGAPETVDAIRTCARTLAAAGCDVVVQVGTPFAWAGTTSEREARERAASIQAAAGVPVIMTGLAIIDALRALGARRPALACTYYDRTWSDAWAAFVRGCGFEPASVTTMADQGLVEAGDTLETQGFSMTADLAEKTIEATAHDAPDADAVVVTGTGTRTLTVAPVMEMSLGKPLVGSDTVTYWMAAQWLGLALGDALGRLGNVPAEAGPH